MTKREIKKLKKLLNMQNQKELKKEIEICKEFYILKHQKKYLFEKAPIYLESFYYILMIAKISIANMEIPEIIRTIEEGFNYEIL